jgi:flavin-dependent dehydrogenase
MGGGLSGLSLAIQLKLKTANLRILIAEKAPHPAPESAHKVGESSVEIASHYFENILGLQQQLDNELPKFGLRFFYTQGRNSEIGKRIELGSYEYPMAKSYQIDRGRFENALAEHCLSLGIDFQDNCKIKEIALGENDHQITLLLKGQEHIVQTSWVVDATGRMGVLKRKLKLARPAYHDVNASWFRIDHNIDIDDWYDDPEWRARAKVPRRLSTNHLMGKGYWVWLIPLASGSTSIGIVADANIHPYAEINTFARAQAWLHKYEPQCAQIIAQHQEQLQDFLSLKHYSHNCKKMYSADGWAITGDAGVFLDPFYSPGSDFIALNNGFISDLIIKQQAGMDIVARTEQYEKLFRTLFLAFSPVYEDQYPIMGNAKVMSIKIIWDYTLYWSGAALLYFRDKFCDLEFMQTSGMTLQQIYQINRQMQGLFRYWAEVDSSSDVMSDIYINYSNITFLQQLNKDLLKKQSDPEVQQQLTKNVDFIKELAGEIVRHACSVQPELKEHVPLISENNTDHLGWVFDLLR